MIKVTAEGIPSFFQILTFSERNEIQVTCNDYKIIKFLKNEFLNSSTDCDRVNDKAIK